MASPVHKQPPPYYYTPAPPSSHSPQHHSHSHSHSHSQASTPFTTASSVHSPPLSHQLTHPTSAIGYPPFNPYPEHPTSNGHSHSYSSSGGYHHSTPYDGYTVAGQNALQLQPPPLDTSVSYHPSVPSAGAGGASSYIPTRPSPLQHSHSQRITPGVQQLSGRGQPAGTTHPPTGVNTLPPVGSGASGVSTGASAPATAQGQSASAAANVVGADGQAVRKRPKYTRSKAGCLICRQKKVKCDEKKPTCTRCLHGHREVSDMRPIFSHPPASCFEFALTQGACTDVCAAYSSVRGQRMSQLRLPTETRRPSLSAGWGEMEMTIPEAMISTTMNPPKAPALL